MTTEGQISKKISKKASESITKFNYCIEHVLPALFPEKSEEEKGKPEKDNPTLIKTIKGNRNLVYNFVQKRIQGVQALDNKTILESAKKVYLDSQFLKINEHSFKKTMKLKVPYLPIYGEFHQILQFIIVHPQDVKVQSSKVVKGKQHLDELNTVEHQKKQLQDEVQLYIIHHCHTSNEMNKSDMKWHNFIQKYHFLPKGPSSDTQHHPTISYTMIFAYEAQPEYFSFIGSQQLYNQYLKEYCLEVEGSIKNLMKMQGYLLQSQDKLLKVIKQLNEPCYSDEHRRQLRLPMEQYKHYSSIKKQALSYYSSINEEKEVNEIFISNLVCRYMEAKEYNFKQSLESTLEYLKWEKHMSDTYTLTQFATIHRFDIYTVLGEGFTGKKVILNKAKNVLLDQINDDEKYSAYYIYFLEIYLQKKMKGYADQVIIIADVKDLSSANFKLAVTKRNLADSLKYSPERQYKFIAVNIGLFAHTVWSFLGPLLPKKTAHKITFIGCEKKDIVDELSKWMDVSIIPEYLGGQNKITYEAQLIEKTDSSDQSEELSFKSNK